MSDATNNKGRPQWYRQRRETPKQWQAFVIYRDMGNDRSLQQTADALDLKTKSNLEKWSVKNDWIVRSAAWDERRDEKNQEKRLDAVEEMAERHAEVAKSLIAKVIERVATLKPEELQPGQCSHWLDVAVKIERLSRGAPTAVTRTETDEAEKDEARRVLADAQTRRSLDQAASRIHLVSNARRAG